MSKSLPLALSGLVCAAVFGLSACTDPAPSARPLPDAPQRLSDLVVTDPDFDFATTETVRLELQVPEGAAPQAVEAFDAEGRRLMDGAFKAGASVDLKVPVGKADTVKLRIGTGEDAVERELTVSADGQAVGKL